MTTCNAQIQYLESLVPQLILNFDAQIQANGLIRYTNCCAVSNVETQNTCLLGLIGTLDLIEPGFTLLSVTSQTNLLAYQSEFSAGGDVPWVIAGEGTVLGLVIGGGRVKSGAVTSAPPGASSASTLTSQVTIITNVTTTWVFCACYNESIVNPVPVAVGSTEVSNFTNSFFTCLLAGLNVTNDYYYSPDGTSASCELLSQNDRAWVCMSALSGNVTTCGDN